MPQESFSVRLANSPLTQAAGGAALGAFFGVLLRVAGLVTGSPVWLVALFGAVLGGGATRAIVRTSMGAGERLAKELIFPDAEGTYAPQYSYIEALEVQEKHREAVEGWLAVADEKPGNPSPLLRAADLELRKLNDAPAALALYERVRRIQGIREEHVRYASQKIIDIHLATGGDEGRALVELRRFIETFPEGREAEGARAAIARIKAVQARPGETP
jgi:hypothetical protein